MWKPIYETKGYPATNAVDGKNVMESFWGTKGSKNAKDLLTVTFKNGVQEHRRRAFVLHQTSSSQTIAGYSEPSVYTLEYQDEAGAWHVLPEPGAYAYLRGSQLQPRAVLRSWPKPFVPPSPASRSGHWLEGDSGLRNRHLCRKANLRTRRQALTPTLPAAPRPVRSWWAR